MRRFVKGTSQPSPQRIFPIPQSLVLSPSFSVLGSQFLVLNSWFSVPGSQFSVLGSQFLVLSSRFSLLPLSPLSVTLTVQAPTIRSASPGTKSTMVTMSITLPFSVNPCRIRIMLLLKQHMRRFVKGTSQPSPQRIFPHPSVPGSWFSVPGSQFSVPGSRFLALGSHSCRYRRFLLHLPCKPRRCRPHSVEIRRRLGC